MNLSLGCRWIFIRQLLPLICGSGDGQFIEPTFLKIYISFLSIRLLSISSSMGLSMDHAKSKIFADVSSLDQKRD